MAQRVIKTMNLIRGSGAILKLILDGISTVVIYPLPPFLYPCLLNEAFYPTPFASLLLQANLNDLNIVCSHHFILHQTQLMQCYYQ